MMFQMLCNANCCLMKFKALDVATKRGHLAFCTVCDRKSEDLSREVKPFSVFPRPRPLPSQALQPSSNKPSDKVHEASTPGLLKTSSTSCLFWTLTQFFSPALKATFFSFPFHDQVLKPSLYDFSPCSESASNVVTLYGLGASPIYRLRDEHFQRTSLWLLRRSFHAMPKWIGIPSHSSTTHFIAKVKSAFYKAYHIWHLHSH